MAVDNRDDRIRVDLPLPPEIRQQHPEKLAELRDLLLQALAVAVVINEGQDNEERGFIEIERCGHRIGESCEKIARWEVGRGKVYPEE